MKCNYACHSADHDLSRRSFVRGIAVGAASLAGGLGGALAATPAYAVYPYHGHMASRADVIGRYYSAQRPWHGPYAYTQWGTPVSLVVPPNSKMHTPMPKR